jgi:hypothetical protein
MEAKILDGKQTSKEIVDELKAKFEQHPTDKKLAIISVGDDYGSAVYCNMKKKKAEYIGIGCEVFHFEEGVSQEEVESKVKQLAEDDSFAGININMNLENAINFSEQLFINLYEIYESYKIDSKIGIGITTRSMRLVPGNRLINEAKQAAEKALEEETMPIVAFKVNHEKYREYVSEEA